MVIKLSKYRKYNLIKQNVQLSALRSLLTSKHAFAPSVTQAICLYDTDIEIINTSLYAQNFNTTYSYYHKIHFLS